jgi:hypothetical protein
MRFVSGHCPRRMVISAHLDRRTTGDAYQLNPKKLLCGREKMRMDVCRLSVFLSPLHKLNPT